MNFLQKIKDSIYSPSFYQTLPTSQVSQGIGYFAILMIIIAFLNTLISAPGLLNIGNEIKNLATQAINVYPAELEIFLKDGKVSTNVNEPYTIPMSSFTRKSEDSKDFSQNGIIIDTKTPYSAEQFKKYKTWVWITKDSVFYTEQGNDQIKSLDLSKLGTITITKKILIDILDKVAPYFSFVSPLLIILFLIGSYVFLMFRLVYLFFGALLIWVIMKLLKKDYTYSQAYKIGIYAMTAPIIFEFIVGTISKWTNFNGFGFMFTLLLLLVVLINFKKDGGEK